MSLLPRDYIHLIILAIPGILIVFFIYQQFSINASFKDIGNHLGINFSSILFGYGFLLPLFIYQLFWLPKSNLKTFLSLWFLVTLFLAILPFGPGKVYLRGLFFPITLLGILTIEEIPKRINYASKHWLLFLFCALLIGSNVYIFSMRMSPDNYIQSSWVYMAPEEYGIFQFLNENTQKDSSILALYKLGNMIPAFTHNRVYFGHMHQTPDGVNKDYITKVFFTGQASTEEEKKFFKENNISYVIWGKDEIQFYQNNLQKNNTTKNPVQFLHLVYKIKDVKVFSTK